MNAIVRLESTQQFVARRCLSEIRGWSQAEREALPDEFHDEVFAKVARAVESAIEGTLVGEAERIAEVVRDLKSDGRRL